MGVLQRLAYKLFSDAERESRRWVFGCPECGEETSVHDLGGVRYGAAGNPSRAARCKHCRWTGQATFYQRETPLSDTRPDGDSAVSPASAVQEVPRPSSESSPPPAEAALQRTAFVEEGPSSSGCRLWIDGVGCWQLSWGDAFSIGGPSSKRSPSHLSLPADLIREHAVIRRKEESYRFEPLGPVKLNGHPIDRTTYLKSGDRIGLGDDVRLTWRVPSELSPTAVIEFHSEHRPSPRIDGVVLVHQHCLLGSGPRVHIPCAGWERELVLFVRERRLWCRADDQLALGGRPVQAATPLTHGDVLTGGAWRLRVEIE